MEELVPELGFLDERGTAAASNARLRMHLRRASGRNSRRKKREYRASNTLARF
jgi:hypothetical protein